MRMMTDHDVLRVRCPRCGSHMGEPCVDRQTGTVRATIHTPRRLRLVALDRALWDLYATRAWRDDAKRHTV